MLGTGIMPLKRQTSFPLMEGNFWLRKAGSKRVNKQSVGLEGFSEEVTVKQRPEERKGWALGGRAFQAEGTVPTKAPRRSGEVIRLCSPREPSRGFVLYAEQAGQSAKRLVQKTDVV